MGPQTEYVIRASRVMVRHPGAAAERLRGRLDRKLDGRAMRASGLSTDELYPIDDDWLRHLHEALGDPWPCGCAAEADALYERIMGEFGARALPGRYAGWCDGSPGFTKAAWALVSHLDPARVVETGVARGVTSRFVLERFEQTGSGELASVDLPSIDPRLHEQIAAAIPIALRRRWSYISGTSRQRLPQLLAASGGIDMFVHDSLHTGSNLRFELERAWKVLRPGGAMLVDDVYQSLAFKRFLDALRPRFSCVAANPDGSYRFGIVVRAGGAAAEGLAGARA